MAENGPIEEIAKIVSEKILNKFGWEQVGPYDQDFPCRKEERHKPEGKDQQHTHPVDVVWMYKDPYLNKNIYFSTDLKSYSKDSINVPKIEGALSSLCKTVDCARNSDYWNSKYNIKSGASEVRGLLFVYNHDNKSKKDFYEFFYPKKPKGATRKPRSVSLDKLGVVKGQQIHIIDPKVINYMMTIVSDMNEMIAEMKFPRKEYGFFYPQLTYHKVSVSEKYLPAAIEMITAPYLIVNHGPVVEYDPAGSKEEKFEGGFVVYYNRAGDNDLEFLYLLDTLSRYQILNGRNKIRVRVACETKSPTIRSNFKRAIDKYAHDWGYDEESRKSLDSIELSLIPLSKEFYLKDDIGWREGK